jgi:hypothetical protein
MGWCCQTKILVALRAPAEKLCLIPSVHKRQVIFHAIGKRLFAVHVVQCDCRDAQFAWKARHFALMLQLRAVKKIINILYRLVRLLR